MSKLDEVGQGKTKTPGQVPGVVGAQQVQQAAAHARTNHHPLRG